MAAPSAAMTLDDRITHPRFKVLVPRRECAELRTRVAIDVRGMSWEIVGTTSAVFIWSQLEAAAALRIASVVE